MFGFTENGALSNINTGSAVLDLFAHGAALRTAGDSQRIIPLLEAAYKESPILTLVTLFHIRDVRGGQGEREVFRLGLNWLANNHPDVFTALIPHIPHYGRWDDLLIFGPHAIVGHDVVKHVAFVLKQDQYAHSRGGVVSLLAKWMPSENASSSETRAFAYFWMERLGYVTQWSKNQRAYRKLLSKLRAYIDIVERRMSFRLWNTVDYARVPGKAGLIYRKAFARHDGERYTKHIADGGKLNAGTLYPYEIIKKVLSANAADLVTLNAIWSQLPNYFGDSTRNVICVCDTSGSMSGMPLLVAISLTLYAAERMNGLFADTAITFSHTPEFVTLPRSLPIEERLVPLYKGQGLNTNFQAVFDMILTMAVECGAAQDQMPTDIFCISDMQFDEADQGGTNFQVIRQKYKAAGYTMPRFIMWNVRSAPNDAPVTMHDTGVYFVSGCSPIIFKNALLLDTTTTTAYDAMLITLYDTRYDLIREALQ